MIARVTDGLPLAEGLDDGRDVPDSDFYKQQVKSLFKNLSRGHNEASRMSVETGSYIFQYPIITHINSAFIIHYLHCHRDLSWMTTQNILTGKILYIFYEICSKK